MTAVDFRPPLDEPAVHDPRLRVLVDAARGQAPPTLRVDAQAVHVGWQQRRAGQRRGLAVGLAVAAAVVVTLGLLELRRPADDIEAPMAVQQAPEALPTAGSDASPLPVPAPEATVPREPLPPAAEPGLATPVLAASIMVSPLPPTTATPEVLGPRQLRLPDGHWSIDSEGSEPVEVALPDGALQLRGGSVHVQVAGDVAHVQVLREQVLRVDAEGHWTTLRPQAPEPAGPSSGVGSAGPSPGELAREAEELMAAGDRQGAIRTLRRLVTRHGRSAAAQAGLIDLGRLLKAAGQTDAARCAYGLFLARWPAHALAGDVTRARSALGDGPTCDGLRPR
jgi:hypothetical protein